MCSGGVYSLWSTQTDECLYVGETSDLSARWSQHKTKLRHHKHPAPGFSEWYDAQGPNKENSIRFEILARVDGEQDRKRLEAYWFDQFLPRFFGRVPILSMYYEEYTKSHPSVSDSGRRNMSAAQLKRYKSDARTVYVGDKVVVGLPDDTQYTTVPIEERICVDCGEHFYAVASYARQQCQDCWEKNPIRKEALQYDYERPDEQRQGSLSDLTEDVLRKEYLELGLSTCEIAKRYGTSDVTVINRANRWHIPLRNRQEAIGATKEKHKRAILEQVNYDLLELLWSMGVSAKLSRRILNVGAKLYNEIIATRGMTRPSIRSKGIYSPMTPQMESDLRRFDVPEELIVAVSNELERYR